MSVHYQLSTLSELKIEQIVVGCIIKYEQTIKFQLAKTQTLLLSVI